jgi:hypothetical protein
MITLLIVRLIAFAFACWWFLHLYFENRKLAQAKELWKTLAIATEVQLECIRDYYTRIDGEGCMTRSRRREKDMEQSNNAEELAEGTKDALVTLGEREPDEEED